MKVFITLACAVAAARAGLVVPKIHEEGSSVQYRSEDGLGNYQFGYDEKHTTGGSFRKEKGDGLGRKVGSYGLHDADGRVRVVNYVADEQGFRAAVQTNEPGVAPEDPAATSIEKAPTAIPYAAPMHLDHVTGVKVGLASAVAGPVVGAYSAPVAQIAGPIVAPVGYHRQPMHFTSVLGPSVSHLIGSMPSYIGAYVTSRALHPLDKDTASYQAPVAVSVAAAAPVAAYAPAAPPAPVVYKAPTHFAGVIGPSVSHMLNEQVPQHIAGQKLFRSLQGPAVHYEAGPIVSPLHVAPAAPVVDRSLAYNAAPVASYALPPAIASYDAAPVPAYAAHPVASYRASYGISAAQLSSTVEKSVSHPAVPALVSAQYASAPYRASSPFAVPIIQKQIAYGPPVVGHRAGPFAYSTGPAVTKNAGLAGYAPPGGYIGAEEVASDIAYAYGPAAGPVYAEFSTAYDAAPVSKLAPLPTYATPVYAAPPPAKSIYSYGPLSVESTIAKPAIFAAPAFGAPLAVPDAAHPDAHITTPIAAPIAAPIATHIAASPFGKAPVHQTGISSVSADFNGYTHELIKPGAYTRVYHYMYGQSPSFYGYSYSPYPLGHKKK